MKSDPRVACRVAIRGVVQGVGFRPFVYRCALQHRISGWVLNDAAGVEIHAEAAADRVTAFLAALQASPPSAARIAHFQVQDASPQGFAEFEIRASRRQTAPITRISPDLAVCADCVGELNDPANRRFHYPYVNCTNCGPRYSIIRQLPYDRAQTTMAPWALCAHCRSEYTNPLDRRYHAQPIACEACGPGYYFVSGDQCTGPGDAAIHRAAEALRGGMIVAVKGIGGYHLACDGRNTRVVDALRTRKFRKEKPFAVMVRDLEEARELIELTPAHEALLTDVARPIVLAPARVELPGVAPDNDSLGVMLPYVPLHHLLFEHGAPSPLVLTSANRSSEPIAFRDDDARERLAEIADAFLVGERPIARRVDDSVVGVRAGKPFMVRRARGYAPAAVCQLPARRPVLALGGDLKNAIALVVEGEAFVSQHLGDLDDFETRLAFEQTVGDLLSMYDVKPAELIVAHDLHPQFKSTQFATAMPARRHIAVQHHHAHIASVMAEHGLLDEPVVGVALDGTGYGGDGTIWGGEFFVGSVRGGFQRRAWLRPVRMPGGDAAARFPVQAAAGFLAELAELPNMTGSPFCFPRRFQDALALVGKNVRCFTSSSVGRLFDAVAALLGFTREATFEGQAAVWLEQQARQCPPQPPYPLPFGARPLAELDHRPVLSAVISDRLSGRPCPEVASAFHAALAAAVVSIISGLCREHKVSTVALSGGVFQNELLLKAIQENEALQDLRVLSNERVPVNDGGISLGQAALAVVGPKA
jgi:hydrogenase maturation protein HypF